MIRILIADDQQLFSSMLKEILQRDEEIEIIALCKNGHEAVDKTLQLKPDLVLLDIGMPEKGGIDALGEIKKALPKTKVAMLTTFEDEDNIKDAILLGADGYLIKDLTQKTLISAIKNINNDIVLLHRGAYRTLQVALNSMKNCKDQKLELGEMIFDSTDVSIMKMVVQGKSNKDICNALNYSEGTIKNRVSKMLSITGLSNRMELSVFAINNQII